MQKYQPNRWRWLRIRAECDQKSERLANPKVATIVTMVQKVELELVRAKQGRSKALQFALHRNENELSLFQIIVSNNNYFKISSTIVSNNNHFKYRTFRNRFKKKRLAKHIPRNFDGDFFRRQQANRLCLQKKLACKVVWFLKPNQNHNEQKVANNEQKVANNSKKQKQKQNKTTIEHKKPRTINKSRKHEKANNNRKSQTEPLPASLPLRLSSDCARRRAKSCRPNLLKKKVLRNY